MKACVIYLVCLCALIGGSAAASSNSISWREFKRQHEKVYGPEEDAMRFANFLATKQRVERHNANSSVSYKMGLNHLSDWSEEEFKRMIGPSPGKVYKRTDASEINEAFFVEFLKGPVPDELDWRKVPNRVGDVKDQGQCNAGWAFATSGMLEGQQTKLNFSKLVPLSEQELVDCSSKNLGCKAGAMIYALDAVQQNGGIESEADYKYEASAGQCRLNPSKVLMEVRNSYTLASTDEPYLKRFLAKYGPLGTTIAATENLKNYHSGVLDDPDCDPEGLNHDVLLVGYGRDENGLHYWLVKNSWGADWGDEGYFKIRRGVNMCGISYGPTVAEVV